MELNRTRHFLAYDDDINLLGESISRSNIQKITQPLSGASGEIYVDIFAEEQRP
jgi:hypothetical protein